MENTNEKSLEKEVATELRELTEDEVALISGGFSKFSGGFDFGSFSFFSFGS